VCASLAIFLAVPEKTAATRGATARQQFAVVASILRNRVFWSIGLTAVFAQSIALALLGLWAGPWMRDVAGLDRADLARDLLFAAGAFGVGAVMCGTLSDGLARRGVPPLVTYLAGCVACTVALIPIALGYGAASVVLWIVYMALSPSGTLAYPLLTARFPREMTGRVMTALNMFTFMLAFGIQYGIGAIIGLWPVTDGRYAVEGYRAAFGLCWVLQAAAVAWLAYAERAALRR
jgi:hypothetical protein